VAEEGEAAAEEECDEEEVNDGEFEVTHELLMKHFRLASAVPACYSQGRTYRDKTLLLMDTSSRHYTMRHLIVAISRVTTGGNLWIAPHGFEGTIFDMARSIKKARKRGQAWQRPSPATSSSAMEVDGEQPGRRQRIWWPEDDDDAADARMVEEDSD
jgi:hypothetical protein